MLSRLGIRRPSSLKKNKLRKQWAYKRESFSFGGAQFCCGSPGGQDATGR